MKRISVNIFLSYVNLFKDLIVWGQVDPYEAERDCSRIVSVCETRGERSIFIDFPRCAKSLDYALSRGYLDRKKFAILGKHQNGLPAFMNSCWKKVFHTSGFILSEPDIGAVQALRQVLLLYKKVQIPCTEERIKNEVQAFFSLDRALRSGSDSWWGLDFDLPGRSNHHFEDAVGFKSDEPSLFGWDKTCPTYLVRLFQRVCDQVVRRFHQFDPDTIVGNHGPGAVADQKAGLDKYVFPTWSQQLERVFPRDLHSCANVRVFEYGSWYVEQVQGSLRTIPAKLIPVNKTQEKPRLIASEPTANQFVQGGLKKFIRKQISLGVLAKSIAITKQSLSRDLAIGASKGNGLATVDLSNASDRLSMWAVERVFRKAPALLNALAASRSPWLEDKRYTKETVLLRKYAPQGNATVFPLQSIVYACISIACVIWSTPRLKSRSDAELWASVKEATRMVRVYGDDIILPETALPALSSVLELCELAVNGPKSHYSGRFAESCGMDAFMGTDVTPVYMASVEDEVKPGGVQSAVDISYDCYNAGLINLGNLVAERIPEHIRNMLCMSHLPGPSTMLFTYSNGIKANRSRFNKDLQMQEYQTLVSLPKSDRAKRDGWESLLQYFIEGPPTEPLGIKPKWVSGWTRESRTKLVRRWVPMHG
jgi:hypothetical protein